MNYTHLTIEERACLRKYYVEGKSYRKIAKLLGRSPSTISREIARNYTHRYAINTYYPHTAQKKYLLRRSFCHRGMFRDKEVIDYINEKLAELSNPSSPYALVTKMPKAKGKFFLYWIMTQRNLNNLKKSAAYKDYMMLHDWSFI